MLSPKSPFLYALFALLLTVLALFISQSNTYSPEQLAKIASVKTEQKLQDCKTALDAFDRLVLANQSDSLFSFFEEEQIALYRFKKDSLIFWNNSRINPDWKKNELNREFGLVKLRQGYCLFYQRQKEDELDVALCLIQPDYPIRNKYLKNSFQDWSGLFDPVHISSTEKGAVPVVVNGKHLFFLNASEPHYGSVKIYDVCAFLFFASIGLFLLAIISLGASLNQMRFWLLGIFLVLFRCTLSLFKWPEFLYQSSFYDVHEFGNAGAFLNNYLGDYVFNALFFLTAAIVLKKQQSARISAVFHYLSQITNLALLFLIYRQFNHGIANLVSNSTLSFDLLSIFNMKSLAFAAIALLACYAIAIYICLNTLLYIRSGKQSGRNTMYLLAVLALCFIMYLGSAEKTLISSFWLLAAAAGLWMVNRLHITTVSYTLTLHLLLCSLFASYLFNRHMQSNQESEMKLLSYRLSERQDPALESEYKGIDIRIQNDGRLQNLIALLPNTQKEITLLLRQKYFGSYFDRYATDFFLFDKNCTPLLTQTDPLFWNQGYFEDQIRYRSDSTSVPELYFVEGYKEASLYLARLSLKDHTLFIRMEAKQMEEQGSFPDLLLDESQQKQEKLGNLSYAVYRSGRLVNRYGDYNYPHFSVDPGSLEKAGNSYKHYVFVPEETSTVLISEKQKTGTQMFTYNSYLFLIFFMIGFTALYFNTLFLSANSIPATLTQRIQGSIILLLLFAMTAVGVTSSRLVFRQFENDNKKDLSDKSAVVLNELLSQFTAYSLFDGSQKELVNQKLRDYARLFSSDLSLFNAEGRLVSTSQPKLYELGLSSSLMQPKAYRDLKLNLAYSSHVMESAGKLQYHSEYIPIYDTKNVLQGFINLPYFAKQSSLLKELSGIISGLINVYLILFMLSIATGLLLSGYITRPLRIIKQQISRIRIGTRNETIHWPSDDEIGKLVSEYNNMLVKLEESANLLAQSERESAWREMAKQVAHEIKNPLTPMKLNLQYLQHLIKTHPEDFKNKFEEASAGIIEQIDSLANIATEFSHLARLPGTQLQRINLAELIDRAVQLFGKHQSIQITNRISEKMIPAMGDKDQCLRVFNNILSNAVQALEDRPNPSIEIDARLSEKNVIISIRDNGCGIPEELQPVMFTPNFTTKNTGSGLGLAMVKNIMLGFGGKVWFESKKNLGSTFYLEFVSDHLPEDKNT